jgi:gamma-glutamyltranspeptidase / glutathione hydrolase
MCTPHWKTVYYLTSTNPLTRVTRKFLTACSIIVFLSGCETGRKVPPGWQYPLDAPAAEALHAMVASTSALATNVGVAAMREGGNAADAAIATAFALAVTHPSAGNIGGGGFIVARFGDSVTVALDFREKAPGAARREMFMDPQGQIVRRSTSGHLSAGVPGTVQGMWELHKKFGSRPWAELIAPAIKLAEEGFVVDERMTASIQEDSSKFARYPASMAMFLPGGRPLEAGKVWKNPELGSTLRRIAAEGPAGFYGGKTADLLVAEMQRGGGLITREDLKSYSAVWRTPITFTYRGHTFYSMPPPSSGGIALAMIGHILEGYDLDRAGWHSPQAIHLTAEAMRRAFADRNTYLGDPEFVKIPLDKLLSQEHAAERRASIRIDRATPSTELTVSEAPRVSEPMHTTHFSVVDDHGNAVAMTTTLNLGYGSGVVVPGAGFLLNNEMDDFAAKPGSPNAFGLVQGEANAIAPGKRMLSSMSPTIMLDSLGKVCLVTGAAGGPRIITSVFQVISNIVDFHLSLPAAMNSPRIHEQDFPDRIGCEEHGFLPATLEALRAMGHVIKEEENQSSVSTIYRSKGVWQGMAEPRGEGSARGY